MPILKVFIEEAPSSSVRTAHTSMHKIGYNCGTDTAQNSSDNLASYPPDNHSSDVVYLRAVGLQGAKCEQYSTSFGCWSPVEIKQDVCKSGEFVHWLLLLGTDAHAVVVVVT